MIARRLTPAVLVVLAAVFGATPSALAATTVRVDGSFGAMFVFGDAGGVTKNDVISVAYRSADARYVVTATDESGGGVAPDNSLGASHCVQGVDARQVVCERLPAPAIGVFGLVMRGEAGNDVLKAGYGADAWHASDPATIEGGAGVDFIGGSPTINTLYGGGGADVLDGAGGDDELLGLQSPDGPGVDKLYGGPGSDTLTDGDAESALDGDELDGGICPNTVPGCVGTGGEAAGDRDLVDWFDRSGGVRADLSTENGNGATGELERLRNLEDATTGAGADTLIGDARANRLIGGGGIDSVSGANGGDDLNGGTGLDSVGGGDGNDFLQGGSALNGASQRVGDGRDQIDGGNGTDTLDYVRRATAVNSNLANADGHGEVGTNENDRVVGVENVTGGDVGDQLTGNGQTNALRGGDGNDTIDSDGDVGSADDVDCGGGSGDSLVRDADDTDIGCESVTGGGGPVAPVAVTRTAVDLETPTRDLKVGEALVLKSRGQYSGTGPITFVHDWVRCAARSADPDDASPTGCDVIAGTRDATRYLLKAADVGKYVGMREVASGPGGAAPPRDSGRLGRVQGLETNPPLIAIESPTSGMSVVQGASAIARFDCGDSQPGDSGIQFCQGFDDSRAVASGQALETREVKSHTFSVQAVDRAGNETWASVTWTIVAPAAKRYSVQTVRDTFTPSVPYVDEFGKLIVSCGGDSLCGVSECDESNLASYDRAACARRVADFQQGQLAGTAKWEGGALGGMLSFGGAPSLPGGRDPKFALYDGAGQVIASGGGNLIGHAGGNLIGHAGGNLTVRRGSIWVPSGTGTTLIVRKAGDVVDASGELIGHAGGNFTASPGGNVVFREAGWQLRDKSGRVIASGGGNVIASGGGNVIASGGGNVIASGGGNVIASGGGNLIGHAGGNVIAIDGSNAIVIGSGSIAAIGAGALPKTMTNFIELSFSNVNFGTQVLAASGAAAAARRRKQKPMVVARARVAVRAPGAYRVTLTLTKAGRKLLRRLGRKGRKVRLTLRNTITPRTGKPLVETRRFSARPRSAAARARSR